MAFIAGLIVGAIAGFVAGFLTFRNNQGKINNVENVINDLKKDE